MINRIWPPEDGGNDRGSQAEIVSSNTQPILPSSLFSNGNPLVQSAIAGIVVAAVASTMTAMLKFRDESENRDQLTKVITPLDPTLGAKYAYSDEAFPRIEIATHSDDAGPFVLYAPGRSQWNIFEDPNGNRIQDGNEKMHTFHTSTDAARYLHREIRAANRRSSK